MSITTGELDPLIGEVINGSRRHLGTLSAVFLILNRIIGTGIFSIPSSIYQLTGSVGYSLALWVAGGFIAACGFAVYLEYGLQMPHSGGEKNYLERVYYWPPRLALTIFATTSVLMSFSTSNSYAFGNYLQLGLGYDPDETVTRWIGIVTVGSICFIHAKFPDKGRLAFNSLGFIKVIILGLISICGPLLALGIINYDGGEVARHNFGSSLWHNDGFGGGAYEFGTALLRVSYSYRGWETCNMVMSEVKDPQRTVIRAGMIAVIGITSLYTMCTYAYFVVIPKEEVASSGVVIAGVFLLRLFGESTSTRLLPLVICLSNLGNILVVTYAASRVIQEIGKHNILPASSILGSNRPWGTPVAGLSIHFLMTVLTMTLPPKGEIYNFVIDVSTYPVTVFAFMITVGLIGVHRNPSEWGWHTNRGYSAPTLLIMVFLFADLIMLLFPWIPPPIPKAGLPYYASALTSLMVLCIGAAYWYFRYEHIIAQIPPELEIEYI